jgi:DNA invertase Pin-like site-specific DNA recombinase
MKRILSYGRISTKDKGQVVEAQLDPCRAYIASRSDWAGCTVEEFIDKGHSGSKDRRPALDRLMAAVRTGTVDAVVVYKLDRFGRSLQHLIAALQEFKSFNTDFVSVTERLDTTTAQGELLFNLLGSFAQFERSLIVERVNNGIAHARRHGTKSGQAIGRPRVICDRESLRQDRAANMSLRQIAAKYRISTGSVRNILASKSKAAPAMA